MSDLDKIFQYLSLIRRLDEEFDELGDLEVGEDAETDEIKGIKIGRKRYDISPIRIKRVR